MRMLKFLAPLLLALLPALAQASFTVNNVQGNFTSSAATFTVTITVSAGHTVVACLYGKGGGSTTGTIVDSSGTNVYTIGTAGSNSNFTVGCGYSLAIATGITSVTGTPPGTATEVGLIVWDITATGTIGVATGGTNGNAYAFNSPATTDGITTNTLTATQTDVLLIAMGREASSGQLTAGTGFTSDISFNTNAYRGEHKAVTASAAGTMTDSLANSLTVIAGVALQVVPAAVTNGAVLSNGHPVISGTSALFQ